MLPSSVRDMFIRRVVLLKDTDPSLFYKYGKRDPKPDMTADGYARITHDYLESVSIEVIHYGPIGNILAAAVKCTVTLIIDGRKIVVSDVGEASTAENAVMERNAALRFAATRARKRALAHATGIDQGTIIKILEGRIVATGEDYDVPFDDNSSAGGL